MRPVKALVLVDFYPSPISLHSSSTIMSYTCHVERYLVSYSVVTEETYVAGDRFVLIMVFLGSKLAGQGAPDYGTRSMLAPFKFLVGTVLKIEDAKAAINARAKFFMIPAIVKDVMYYIQNGEVLYIPGTMTPTEILSACEAGAKMVEVGLLMFCLVYHVEEHSNNQI
ncbi:uncharacterized protein DS421_18g614610 [Arachis hypogaea]|nr:uncharacterized protein DS421_18g614610 [Arachis hypogaea]